MTWMNLLMTRKHFQDQISLTDFLFPQLELNVGEFFYVNTDSVQTSVDGWVEAISFTTGKCGFMPINYTERVPETQIWEMEVSVPISQATSCEGSDSIDGVTYSNTPG
jgi:hypothetical protein